MLRSFEQLEEAEQQLVLDAIPLITILVAGADGEMDADEVAWAEKLANIRSFDFNNKLNRYYEQVNKGFEQRLNHYNEALPTETEARLRAVTEKLTEINGILRKMDELDAVLLYKNFKSFAKHVAKASGGIMRWLSIGPREAEVIELPMMDEFK